MGKGGVTDVHVQSCDPELLTIGIKVDTFKVQQTNLANAFRYLNFV